MLIRQALYPSTALMPVHIVNTVILWLYEPVSRTVFMTTFQRSDGRYFRNLTCDIPVDYSGA